MAGASQQLLDLTIVAKTDLTDNGFCYIGYSHEHKRLFRPIYKPERPYLYFKYILNVGDSYRFKVLSMPSPNPTLPHSKDDVVVVDEFPQLISSTDSVNTDVVTERMGNMTVKENELSSEASSSDSNNHDLVSSEMQSGLVKKPLGASNIVEDEEKLSKKTEPTESIDETSAAFEQKDELPSEGLSADLVAIKKEESSSVDSDHPDLELSEMQSDLAEKLLGATNIAENLPTKTVDYNSILFEQLRKLGKTTLEEIFGAGNVQNGKFVLPGTDCPSVGILKCTSDCISIQDVESYGKIQQRVFIRGVTDLPLKAINYPEIPTSTVHEVLLVIGLGREFQPNERVGKRCYLMVVGIFIL
jgi:hypothetical protein